MKKCPLCGLLSPDSTQYCDCGLNFEKVRQIEEILSLNYYEILGINRCDDISKIKAAYRRKAKEYHPDLSKDMDALRFREIREAYEVLSDNDIKAAYDNLYDGFTNNNFSNDNNTSFDEFKNRIDILRENIKNGLKESIKAEIDSKGLKVLLYLIIMVLVLFVIYQCFRFFKT